MVFVNFNLIKLITQDVMFVAPHLIPQAIRYIGETDLSEKYSHSCEKKVAQNQLENNLLHILRKQSVLVVKVVLLLYYY